MLFIKSIVNRSPSFYERGAVAVILLAFVVLLTIGGILFASGNVKIPSKFNNQQPYKQITLNKLPLFDYAEAYVITFAYNKLNNPAIKILAIEKKRAALSVHDDTNQNTPLYKAVLLNAQNQQIATTQFRPNDTAQSSGYTKLPIKSNKTTAQDVVDLQSFTFTVSLPIMRGEPKTIVLQDSSGKELAHQPVTLIAQDTNTPDEQYAVDIIYLTPKNAPTCAQCMQTAQDLVWDKVSVWFASHLGRRIKKGEFLSFQTNHISADYKNELGTVALDDLVQIQQDLSKNGKAIDLALQTPGHVRVVFVQTQQNDRIAGLLEDHSSNYDWGYFFLGGSAMYLATGQTTFPDGTPILNSDDPVFSESRGGFSTNDTMTNQMKVFGLLLHQLTHAFGLEDPATLEENNKTLAGNWAKYPWVDLSQTEKNFLKTMSPFLKTTSTGTTCQNPTNITVTQAQERSLAISWASINDADFYYVFLNHDLVGTTQSNSMTIQDLLPGLGFNITVIAVCRQFPGAVSSVSPTIFAETLDESSELSGSPEPSPTSLRNCPDTSTTQMLCAESKNQNSIVLQWPHIAGAKTYVVRYLEKSIQGQWSEDYVDLPGVGFTDNYTSNSFTFANAKPGATYRFVLNVLYTDARNSDPSNIVEITTPDQ